MCTSQYMVYNFIFLDNYILYVHMYYNIVRKLLYVNILYAQTYIYVQCAYLHTYSTMFFIQNISVEARRRLYEWIAGDRQIMRTPLSTSI